MVLNAVRDYSPDTELVTFHDEAIGVFWTGRAQHRVTPHVCRVFDQRCSLTTSMMTSPAVASSPLSTINRSPQTIPAPIKLSPTIPTKQVPGARIFRTLSSDSQVVGSHILIQGGTTTTESRAPRQPARRRRCSFSACGCPSHWHQPPAQDVRRILGAAPKKVVNQYPWSRAMIWSTNLPRGAVYVQGDFYE